MKNIFAILTVVAVSGATLVFASGLPARHPAGIDLGERKPLCSDCHGDERDPIVFRRYDHTATFLDDHKILARMRPGVCELCHRQESCQDCHATRSELKPSILNQVETYKASPHRGDYITRHRFEARIDPTSCYRCHGNPRRSLTCRRCH